MRFSFGEIDKGPCEIKPAALGCSCTKKIYGKLYQGATFHYKICCSFLQNAHTLHALVSSFFLGTYAIFCVSDSQLNAEGGGHFDHPLELNEGVP